MEKLFEEEEGLLGELIREESERRALEVLGVEVGFQEGDLFGAERCSGEGHGEIIRVGCQDG